jgi:hypothetical protein
VCAHCPGSKEASPPLTSSTSGAVFLAFLGSSPTPPSKLQSEQLGISSLRQASITQLSSLLCQLSLELSPVTVAGDMRLHGQFRMTFLSQDGYHTCQLHFTMDGSIHRSGDEDLGVSVAIPQPTMKCDATRAQVHRLLRLCAEAEAVSARFSYHGIAHMRVTVLSILLGVN